jgi:hypothetical protein
VLARIRERRASMSADDAKTKVYDYADTNVVARAAPAEMKIDVLNKRTLRHAIARLHPMLLACHPDGTPRGRLAVKLRLAGEEATTVVEDVEVTGDPPLSDDADFVECVRTTLESLELPPTNDAAPWDVYFPFVF